jgi:hypothetical protein
MNKGRRKVQARAQVDLDEILPEYDFSYAQPNKYATRYTSHGKASEPKVNLQHNDSLDAEAIFTLGFSDEKARRAFIAEMDNVTSVR